MNNPGSAPRPARNLRTAFRPWRGWTKGSKVAPSDEVPQGPKGVCENCAVPEGTHWGGWISGTVPPRELETSSHTRSLVPEVSLFCRTRDPQLFSKVSVTGHWQLATSNEQPALSTWQDCGIPRSRYSGPPRVAAKLAFGSDMSQGTTSVVPTCPFVSLSSRAGFSPRGSAVSTFSRTSSVVPNRSIAGLGFSPCTPMAGAEARVSYSR